MNKQISKAIGGAALAMLMLAVFTQIGVPAQGQNGSDQSLIGSWDVQVTARDCETGTPIPFIPIFPAMMTYNQGGTMQETDLGGPFSVRLPGHGVWEHQNGRQYSTAFQFLNFTPDRTFVGKNVVRSAIRLGQDGNSYISTDTVEILNANGDVIDRGCATSTATRFE
jgi:hypothetical protein